VSAVEHAAGADGARRVIRVLTVDDQPLFREAARAVAARTPGFEVVAEAADGDAAIRIAREVDPDMVIVDVRMAGRDGIDTARALTDENPNRLVVLVSSADVRELSALARVAGAAALLRKHWLTPRLLRGLWVAHRRR
jgi:two-component system, NarL family, invasion response regulator UvrY